MGVGTFAVGQRFDLDGTRHHITRLLDEGRIEFEDAAKARRQELTQEQMLKHFKQGRLIFRQIAEPSADRRAKMRVVSNALLASVNPAQSRLAALRLHFVKKLQGVTTTRSTFAPIVVSIWNALKGPERELLPTCPHASTVTKWIQQYREADCNINALLDRHALKGNRETRLHPDIEDLIDQLIYDLYLTPERRSIKTVLGDINDQIDISNLGRIESEHLPHVGYECLKARIFELDAYDVYAARYGIRAASVKFRSTGEGARAELPLERAAIDHCRLDLFVVDEETGLPLGRPWLTVILDECTRVILGYSLSFDEPSALTVMRALRHAMLPKDDMDDVNNPWPTWGVIRTLVVDNGPEFHGFSLDHAAGQFGTTVQTCPRRKPWYKGKIERYFRTLQSDLISGIPGRTFSNIMEKGDYDSSKHALISLGTLNRILRIWTVDIYHQRRHTTLGESPVAKWARLIDKVDRHLPDSAEWVDAAFGKRDHRVLGHQGIQFDSLFYNSSDMASLRHRHGDRITVEIVTNDEDVGHLYVLCPDTGEYIKVEAVYSAYAQGMTRWQHRKCREYANALSEESQSNVSLADAKQRIKELIQQDMLLNRRKTRKNQARFLHGDASTQMPKPEFKPPRPRGRPGTSGSMPPVVAVVPPAHALPPAVFQDDDLLELTVSTANQYNQELCA